MADPTTAALWIMIVVSALGWGGSNVRTQEFLSKQSCDHAADQTADMLKKFGGSGGFSVRCVQK